MAERVLVLGGYGVFGSRLSRRLVSETEAEILVAGRSLEKAQAHCRQHGGTPLALDRDGDVEAVLAQRRPTIVIDAAGPFQAYGGDPYRVVRAAITVGAHYLDLADDAGFVCGIDAFDREAKAAGVAVISGASSVPAISAAALDLLTEDLSFVGTVGSAILPGNRAPRGLSVVRAIVAQAGRPLRVWLGGRWREAPAWSEVRRFDLVVDGMPPLNGRLASPIGAPDLLLFPERYAARCVSFHAGLELRLLHVGLCLLALPVQLGLLRSLEPFAGALKWIADRLERFGSDRGGMIVYASGRDRAGRAVERRWTLIAEAGDGPEIPPTPALLLARKLLATGLPLGARPALGELSLEEIEAGLAHLRIGFGRSERPVPPLLERTLTADFATLPPAWRRLAEIYDVDHFAGNASVERGKGLLSRVVGRLFGFPPASGNVAIEVRKQTTRHGETWTRRFGRKAFVSHLSRRDGDGAGVLCERFGPFRFRLRLKAEARRVVWPVEAWNFFGIPLPRALMPKSEASEEVDGDGRFRFDVAISVPFAGLVVRYRGWLAPVDGAG